MNSISRKLTVANALILSISLLLFCLVVSAIYRDYMYSSIEDQLVIENNIATKLLTGTNTEPVIYRVLTDSVNLVYTKDSQTGVLHLSYTSDDDFHLEEDIESLLHRFIDTQNSIITIDIQGQEYLCTISTTRSDSDSRIDNAIISLISTRSIRSVTFRFFFALIACLIVLVVLSFFITLAISRRITKPITNLTQLTKAYADRNFEQEYIANTNDEIQELSISINTMANRLMLHDREKEKLFRHISHEIKTPLTAIYGYAEGIRTEIFTDIDEPLGIIMKESLRIKTLTEDIVFLSKLESKIETFELSPCDIRTPIESAIESVESITILNDIDIVYTPTELPMVNIDPDKIFRAFVNLLSNCIKYTSDTIEVVSHLRDNQIVISISDNGDGFDSDTITSLLSGMTLEKSNGSGIGLSIVKEIIAKHNGEFTISNLPSGGACFTIVLEISR